MERLMPLLVFAGVVMLICLALVVWARQQKSQVVLRAEGAFLRVQRLGPILIRRRTGAMVHSTHEITIYYNDIYFEGGAVLYGIPGLFRFPKPGTLIRLYSDGHSWTLESDTGTSQQ
jgi:hypothetical protein